MKYEVKLEQKTITHGKLYTHVTVLGNNNGNASNSKPEILVYQDRGFYPIFQY